MGFMAIASFHGTGVCANALVTFLLLQHNSLIKVTVERSIYLTYGSRGIRLGQSREEWQQTAETVAEPGAHIFSH